MSTNPTAPRARASAPTIGVVLNPRSRYLRHRPAAIGAIRDLVGARGLVAECHDHASVRRAAEDFRHAAIDILAVVGGDGTAGITIAAFREVWGLNDPPTNEISPRPLPPIAFMRGGTMNTVSNALGLPRGRPEKNLARLIAQTASGAMPPSLTRSTLIADGRIGFLFGTGVFQTFLSAYYQKGHDDPSIVTAAQTIGHAAASALVGGSFIKRIGALVDLGVEVDGEVIKTRPYLTVTAGTVSEVGLGFKAFHLADTYRGVFQLVTVTGVPSSVVFDLPRVWLGLGIAPKNGTSYVARRAVLTAPGGVIEYMVDGDLYRCEGPLVVETGPTIEVLQTGAPPVQGFVAT